MNDTQKSAATLSNAVTAPSVNKYSNIKLGSPSDHNQRKNFVLKLSFGST